MRKLLASLLCSLTLSAAQAQIVGSLPYSFVNGVTADATQVMANYNYIISQVNANAATAGNNANITSIIGLTTPLSAGQGGAQLYTGGTSTGSANAQAVSSGITPVGFTLTAGRIVYFTSGFTNTGATTLAFNGLTPTAIKKLSASGLIALQGGEIVVGNPVVAFFDGTQFNLITQSEFNLFGKQSTLNSAVSSDLGTAPTHNILITGTTTITSLGSTATLDYPIYNLMFSGSLTIAYASPSLVLPGYTNIITQGNDTAVAQYLGSGNWQLISYTVASVSPASIGIALPGATVFTSANNSGTPNTKVDLNASRVIVANSSGQALQYVSPSTCTINFTTTGAGGLDAGSLTTKTWYYTYYISNTVTLSCLGSTSATSPTLPYGYTFSARVGAIETDGSSNFYTIIQTGPRAKYKVGGSGTFPFVLTDGSFAYVAKTVTGNNAGAPTTASAVGIMACPLTGSHRIYVAPNANYSAAYPPVNPAPLFTTGVSGSAVAPCVYQSMVLEASTVYIWSDNASNIAQVVDWVDTANVN